MIQSIPTFRRVFSQMADSEGPAFDQILNAMQRDQGSFPSEMEEMEKLFWEAFQSCRPELGGTMPSCATDCLGMGRTNAPSGTYGLLARGRGISRFGLRQRQKCL
jgi:hypothetical protein